MKRIDEKIQEIEKKDKQNRGLYIGFVVVIIAFMAAVLYYQSALAKKDLQISKGDILNSKLYKDLDSVYKEEAKTLVKLKNSLRPQEYWDAVKEENTVEAYINFITNNWGIDKSEYIDKAVKKLENNDGAVGFDGWLFVGSKNNAGNYKSGNSSGRKTVEIIYRLDKETKTNMIDSLPELKDSEPKIGDVVKLVGTRNYTTYSRKNKVGNDNYQNEQGFRNRTKAVVVDRNPDPNNSNFYVEILYY